jgi:spore protease
MKFKIRTDLAVELREDIDKSDSELSGIRILKEYEDEGKIKITKVIIENQQGAKYLGKDIGNYITLESKELAQADEGYHRNISRILAKYVRELLPNKELCRVLTVGLGNREATPDSLGPRVVDNICITRKMTKEYMSEQLLDKCNKYEVSAIAPGVMAQTGMESAEIIKGIVEEINADIIIAIDSLAARNTSRLNTTIQISDTGINPGSGVGNHRKGLTEENIGIPVIAIGIPTVVDAATIVNDTMENLITIFSMSDDLKVFANTLKNFTSEEKYLLVKEVIDPDISTMYVTPKDVDETIRYISYTISEGLNIIWEENI